MKLMIKTKIVFIFSLIIILALTCGASWLFVFGGVKKFQSETHTIKTGEKDVKKIITATQFVDFVTVLVSGDRTNEYIEYQTYKIEAGVDLEKDKSVVRIINTPSQFDRTVLRKKIEAKDYDDYIKPVRAAFAIKSCDIAVKYELLKNAKKNISEADQQSLRRNKDEILEAPSSRLDVSKLPCYFDTFGDILNEDVKKNLLNNCDFEFSSGTAEFNRDAAEFKIKGKNNNMSIRFGYTGRNFSSDTFESFRDRLQTENDEITVFTYFDPLDDYNTKQVLSYASDDYARAFILNEDGKLFYIDLAVDGKIADGQIAKNYGSFVLYLAMSLQFDDSKTDSSNEYIRYLEDYDKALTYLRKKQYSELKVVVDDMLNQKEQKIPESIDEKMLYNVANYFNHLEFDEKKVNDEFDVLMDNCEFLYDSHEKEGYYKDSNKRSKLLEKISDFKGNNEEVRANMLTYFLQKESEFGLTKEEKNRYLDDLKQTAYAVDKTIIETFDTDIERNKFYVKLFENAENKKLENEEHSDMTFCYIGDTKNSVGGSGQLVKTLKKRNGDLPLGNAFVLVFSDSDLPILSSSEESKNKLIQFFKDMGKTVDNLTKTVHCLVFDNCSVRLFACVDNDSVFEQFINIYSTARKFLTQRHTIKIGNVLTGAPEFIYFWDWRKMNIYKNGTAFLGYDFSNTANYNVISNKSFQKTERAEEIRMIGEILLQLQHAYENDDFHYELALDFVERQLRNYIYELLWRPSLNVSEGKVDKLARYNFIWAD